MIGWLKKYDILNKSLCLLAAILLWFYVVSVQSPEDSKDVKNVNVTLTGKDHLQSAYGLSVIEEVNPTVTIKVSGRREKIAQVSSDKIIATASLSSIDSPGEFALPYQTSVLVDGVTVSGRSPVAITVKVDKIVTTSVPVRVSNDTEAEAGYFLESQDVSPKTVTVKGPQTELSKISYALVTVDSDQKLSKTFEDYFDYKLYDAEDKEIVSDNITKVTESVKLTIPVKKFKEIPFSVNLISAPGVDSSIVSAEITPATVKVTGESSLLDSLNQIQLGSIALSDMQDGSTVDLPVLLPNGLKNMSGTQTVKVVIHMTGVEVRPFTVSRFQVISSPDNEQAYDYVVKADSLAVQLRGRDEILDSITGEMLTAVVDLRDIDIFAGTTVKAPVDILVAGNPDVGLVGEYSVEVEVVKR